MEQVLLNGIAQGLLWSVLSVAFAMVYSSTRVLFFALGSIFAFAPYLFYTLNSTTGIFVSALLVVCSCALGAALLECFVHWPLVRRHAGEEAHMLASLGLFLAGNQIAPIFWGSQARVLRVGVDSVVKFWGVVLTISEIRSAIVSALAVILVIFWLYATKLGMAMRAMTENLKLFSAIGGEVRQIRLLAFAASGALTALAAILSAYDVGFDPNTGMRAVLIALSATVIGGRGSFVFIAIAGILLGVIRSFSARFFQGRWEDAVTFAVLGLSLLCLPGGIGAMRPRWRIRGVAR